MTRFEFEEKYQTWSTPNTNHVLMRVASNLSIRAEAAYLKVGQPRGTQLNNAPTTYIDDFEGTQTNLDIRDTYSWFLSSVPAPSQQLPIAGSSVNVDDISAGYQRAKLSWYNIDPLFYSNRRPGGISDDDLSTSATRRIFIDEIFPQQDIVQGQSRIQNTFDLSFFPNEKGPYNNNLNQDFLNNSKSNWAGITRDLSSTNFEKANVEFIQFWLLDTFSDNDSNLNNLGNLVLNLGNISEDILKDGKKLYENGLPIVNSPEIVNESNWGKTPATQSLIYSFDSNENNRVLQDLGYDGLNDIQEIDKYNNGSSNDPAGDNYQYYIDANGGILNRYKNYNGTQGNSPINVGSTGRGSTTVPDNEDVNQDNTMNTIDSYFEYNVPITKNMRVGNHPFISDVRNDVKVDLPNGNSISTRWIQFKIPISSQFYKSSKYSSFFKAVNGIDNLRSIRFMRMVLKEFQEPVVLRFAQLQLSGYSYRKFIGELDKRSGQDLPEPYDLTVDEAYVTDEGRLFVGDTRILDARSAVAEQAPDVVDAIRILRISAPIPNDTMAFGPDFPEELRTQIYDALVAFSATEAWADSALGSDAGYNWSTLTTIDDATFDSVRLQFEILGLTEENIFED